MGTQGSAGGCISSYRLNASEKIAGHLQKALPAPDPYLLGQFHLNLLQARPFSSRKEAVVLVHVLIACTLLLN